MLVTMTKILVMDHTKYEDGTACLTLLTGSAKDEVIYAEFLTDTNSDVIEMAINRDGIIKMRDFLNGIINKIEPEEPECNICPGKKFKKLKTACEAM